MAAIERDEFEGWMQVLRSDIHGVHTRLDELNGRTRKNETAIAVLEDRDARVKDGHARYVGWGGLVTSVVTVAWQLFRAKP